MWGLNAYGFKGFIETGLDLTTTSSLKIKIIKPSLVVIEKTITNIDIVDVTKGRISVLFQQGDLNEIGSYKIQVFDITTGRNLPSRIGNFTIHGTL